MKRMPTRATLIVYAREAAVVGLVFFLVYPFCNWYGSTLTSCHAFYLDSELSIPFVPQFVWVYLSMYLLFLLPPLTRR